MTCPACQQGNCGSCPDKVMLILGKDTMCTCQRAGHEDLIHGEPRTQQVMDPFTEDIHAPGAVISKDGQVKFTGGQQ